MVLFNFDLLSLVKLYIVRHDLYVSGAEHCVFFADVEAELAVLVLTKGVKCTII